MKIDTRQPASRRGAMKCGQPVFLARHVEPALGGAFLALLRHNADGMRPVPQGDGLHLRRSPPSRRFSGTSSACIRPSMSASEIWRRSSRRCAVMPSAPASRPVSPREPGSGCRRRARCARSPHGRCSPRGADRCRKPWPLLRFYCSESGAFRVVAFDLASALVAGFFLQRRPFGLDNRPCGGSDRPG